MIKTAYNITYKKLADSVVADSLRLRNRQLLVAANRYGQV